MEYHYEEEVARISTNNTRDFQFMIIHDLENLMKKDTILFGIPSISKIKKIQVEGLKNTIDPDFQSSDDELVIKTIDFIEKTNSEDPDTDPLIIKLIIKLNDISRLANNSNNNEIIAICNILRMMSDNIKVDYLFEDLCDLVDLPILLRMNCVLMI